jgi:hypothetical protein
MLRSPSILHVAAAAYYDVAWISDGIIALAKPEPGRTSSIVLVDRDGRQIDQVPRPKSAGCDGQIFSALSRLATGELGFSEICERDAAAEKNGMFLAFDPKTHKVRDLGSVSEPPKVAAWSADTRHAFYTAEGSLCSTIYEHQIDSNGDSQDGPSTISVDAQGERFTLGEDLEASPDHCTKVALSDFPVLARDGSLSAFVCFVDDKHDQQRIDLPWALVAFSAGATTTVVDGVLHPSGLGRTAEGDYVFAGDLAGVSGLWRVGGDGDGLARLADIAVPAMHMSPDTHEVVAILLGELTTSPETETHQIVIYDVRPEAKR